MSPSTELPLQRFAQGWRGDLLALFAGACVPLTFAPLSLFPLVIVALGLLFLLWLNSTRRQAAWRGFLFGLGMFGLGINWIYISVHEYGHVSVLASLFLTLLLIVVMALYPALLGYLLARFLPKSDESHHLQIKLLLVMPASWVLIEWLRGWLFTGFPWLSLGYSQIDSPLVGMAPLLGVYGVSWMVAQSAALLLALLLWAGVRRYALSALLLLWFSGGMLSSVPWTEPTGRPMTVSLIQGNISQDLKWHPGMREPTIELYASRTREQWGRDLIIWPETALPAFYFEVEPLLDELEFEAQQSGSDLLIGLLSYGKERRSYYNTMVGLGSERSFYHKNHLVPFTEYLPLKSMFSGLVDFMDVPMSDFSSGGADQRPLLVAGQRAGISICFEDVFGEEVIRALPEATFLVNVSNDAWFDDSWAPPQHLQIARMRAVESGRPLLRATNTGVSAVVDEKGRLQSVAPQFEVTVLNDTIQPMQGMTPYAVLGNWGVVILMVLSLVVASRLFGRDAANVGV